MLVGLRALGLKVGVLTNRDREFFQHELAAVEGTGWTELFDITVCGDDTEIFLINVYDEYVKITNEPIIVVWV